MMPEGQSPNMSSPSPEGFKKAIMDAIEVLKLNKQKMREVMDNPSTTMYAWIFLIAPGLINTIIMLAYLGRVGFRYYAPSMLLQPISIIVFVYAIHFTAVKFFKGQGDLKRFFRAYGYANALQLLNIPFTLLMLTGAWTLMGLSSIVMLAAAILGIIVGYNALKETYQVSSENAIFSIIIAAVITMVVQMIIAAVLIPILFPMPTPLQTLQDVGDIMKNLGGYQ